MRLWTTQGRWEEFERLLNGINNEIQDSSGVQWIDMRFFGSMLWECDKWLHTTIVIFRVLK